MPERKIVLWSAVFACVISLITGLFGRVSFGIVLLRAIIGGFAFGAFGYGSVILLKRFVPELFEAHTDSGTGDDHPAVNGHAEREVHGGTVDIVLEGEEPSYHQDAGSHDAASHAAGIDSGFIEEIREIDETDDTPQPHVSEEPSHDTSVSEGGREEILGGYGDLSDLDTLPDLEEFSDSFASVAAAQENDSYAELRDKTDNKVDVLEGQHDPATVAKAVRTIIRRDQEG